MRRGGNRVGVAREARGQAPTRAGEVAELAARPDLAAVAERPDVLARAGVLLEALRGATRGTTPRGQARRSAPMLRARVGWVARLAWVTTASSQVWAGQVSPDRVLSPAVPPHASTWARCHGV